MTNRNGQGCWVKACREDDIPFLEGRRVEVEGFYIGVFNTEEGFFAAYDVCPHRGGPLSDGDVAGTTVACPLHGRKIELMTGKVLNDDLSCTFTFPVRIEDGSVLVDVGALTASPAPARGTESAA
jgi:nitrite reductase (NADH) small subunit